MAPPEPVGLTAAPTASRGGIAPSPAAQSTYTERSHICIAVAVVDQRSIDLSSVLYHVVQWEGGYGA